MRKLMLAITLAGASCSPTGETAQNSGQGAEGSSSGKGQATNIRSGPFGFDLGQSVEGLDLKKLDKPGYYSTSSPPKPHADIESVVVEAYPKTGICMIRGIGPNLENDGNGSTVRGKVDELASALETKYGKGKLVDACVGGDVQCQNEFWMMTLNGGERFYTYLWQKPTDQMKAAKIDHMAAAASASNISTSYAAVEYYSSDEKGCDAARKSISASSL